MNPRRQLIIAAVAGVLVTMLFFFFVLTPKLTQIADIRDKVEAARNTEQSLQAELRRLQESRQRTAATRTKLAKLDRYLPPAPDLPSLIRELQRAATASGIDLRSIAPSQPQALDNADGVDFVGVTLTIDGGFRRLEDFLIRLENLPRVLEVRSIAISPDADELSSEFSLSTTIQLRMYVVREDARLTGGGTTVRRPSPSPTPGGNG